MSAEVAQQPVNLLAGIGLHSAERLHKLGINRIQDLLFHLPLRYEDRTRIQAIGSLLTGNSALIVGTVEFTDVLQTGRRNFICRLSDQTGFISLRFFHFSASLQAQLKPGVQLSCFGTVRAGYHGLEMIHPEYKIVNEIDRITEPKLTPIYPLTEGLRQNTIRKTIQQALSLCLDSLDDWMPEELRQQYKFPSLQQALQNLHAPEPSLSNTVLADSPDRKRLAFEELLAHHLILLQGKLSYQHRKAPAFAIATDAKNRLLNTLTFELTSAQKRVISEIEQDYLSIPPMLRLVQGDVGCGKTIVAAIAALHALESRFQVAVMAPTELLAEQHFRNFNLWLDQFNYKVVLLTGKTKGQARNDLLQGISDGSARLIVGTHALFQEHVHFAKLGLIIIDEQHRFGVQQRLNLREKSGVTGLSPHQLVMTATPIPRTLAMLQYSDLDISIIDELPAGRKPVVTSVLPTDRRNEIIASIRNWVKQHRQAYWVCTLIEESEHLQCEAAEDTVAYLCKALPEINIALLHGRMGAHEKDSVMQAFQNHQYDLLVATTVIEVGVDVANAGLMIIENAERLGLSQLHQLRGRVGRGDIESYCLLLYQSPLSEIGKQRLGILRETNDGFVIAEKDLHLRGPGEVMGTRQTGQMQFKIASLEHDQDLFKLVQQTATLLYQQQPDAIATIIQRWLSDSQHYAEV